MKTKEHRCAGCGKLIELQSKIVLVTEGTFVDEDDLLKAREWGKMHPDCFTQAVSSPQAIYKEILKLSTKSTNKVRKSL